jgi:epoxide hydrolase 4
MTALHTLSHTRREPDWSRFDHNFIAINTLTKHVAALKPHHHEAKPIIFLHGFPDIWSVWARTMAALSDTWACYSPDLRGYNLTTRPSHADAYAIEHLLGDVCELIACVDKGDGVYVVGHDWGGVLASWLTSITPHRIAKLVLVNAVHPVALQHALWHDPTQRKASRYIADIRAPDGLAAPRLQALASQAHSWLTSDVASGAIGPDEAALYQAAWACPDAWRAMASWYHASPFDMNPQPPADNWTLGRDWRIDVPTLVAWGTEDPVFTPQTMASQAAFFKSVSFVPFTGEGHNLPRHAPHKLAATIRTFLRTTV